MQGELTVYLLGRGLGEEGQGYSSGQPVVVLTPLLGVNSLRGPGDEDRATGNLPPFTGQPSGEMK